MNQIEPLGTTEYPIVFSLLFGLNLVTECQNYSMSRLNWFPLLIRINRIEFYDSTHLVFFGDLNRLIPIHHY